MKREDTDTRQDLTEEVRRMHQRPWWHSVVLDIAFVVGVALAVLVLRGCG